MNYKIEMKKDIKETIQIFDYELVIVLFLRGIFLRVYIERK